MVATQGAGWRLAPCLRVLVEQIDAAYPSRPTGSDGSIGDRAHAARTSDHNPDDTGLVRAVDITDWPGGAFDPDVWARVHAVRDPRVAYLISDGEIWSRARAGEGWRRYDGANPHGKHLHISVTADGARDVAPWAGITPTAPTEPSTSTSLEAIMAAVYITDGKRTGRATDDTFVHLAPRELEADMTLARKLLGKVRPVTVTAAQFDALAASRVDIRALNSAARRAD